MRKIFIAKEPSKYTIVGHTYYLDTNHSLLVDLTNFFGKDKEPTTLEEFDKEVHISFKPIEHRLIKGKDKSE